MFSIKTDLGTIHVHGFGRNVWGWSITVRVHSVKPPLATTFFELKGLSLSLDAAQAELVWQRSLTEMKMHEMGLVEEE